MYLIEYYNTNIGSTRLGTYLIGGTLIISTFSRTVKGRTEFKHIFLKKGGRNLFYENLKEICDKKKTSPSAVCLALGMSKSNVTEWKRGRSPKLDTVLEIANYLSINPTKLIRVKKVDEQEDT